MKNFMSSLNRVSDIFSNESVLIRNNEVNLNRRFAGLQDTVRRTIITKPKPKTTSSTITAITPFNQHPSHIVNSNLYRSKSVNTKTKPSSLNQKAILPKHKIPNKNITPPLKPNAAERIYKSPATQKMYEDILYGYADYLSHPTPAGVIQYESQIDPVLHVGSFDYSEVNRFGQISPLYSPP